MLPSADKFASRVKKMGIGDGMHVVAYDSEGLYSAARVWWMFRAMGHEEVRVLNGGLKKWKAERRPLEDGEPRRRTERHFTAMLNAELVRDASDVKALIGSKAAQIVDARAAARFAGSVPEPRAGLRSGHIPGSRNVPFASLLNADGTLKPSRRAARHLRRAPASTPPSRWSPRAARASPPASWRWRWPSSAARTPPSTTAPGPNGAPTPPCPSRRVRREIAPLPIRWFPGWVGAAPAIGASSRRSLTRLGDGLLTHPSSVSSTSSKRERSERHCAWWAAMLSSRAMMARPFSSSSRASPGLPMASSEPILW